MSVEFLSPLPTAAQPARSPLLDAALESGAHSEVVDGWEVVASFGDPGRETAACAESVGFADRSKLLKLELQWQRESPGFRGGAAARLGDGWRCPVRPDRELILGEGPVGPELQAELDSAAAHVCDLTASLGAISIAGPMARETIARFCAIDVRPGALPVSGFRPGSVARTPGFLLREGEDSFLLLFGAAYGTYVWETVADAATRLGGRPVGPAALPQLVAEGEPHA